MSKKKKMSSLTIGDNIYEVWDETARSLLDNKMKINFEKYDDVTHMVIQYDANTVETYKLKTDYRGENPSDAQYNDYYSLQFEAGSFGSSVQIQQKLISIKDKLMGSVIGFDIAFYDYDREVYGRTANFWLDSYGGMSFQFGKMTIRINTNCSGNSNEPA